MNDFYYNGHPAAIIKDYNCHQQVALTEATGVWQLNAGLKFLSRLVRKRKKTK